MSFGGIDLTLRAPDDAPVGDLILRACRRHWPAAVFQDAGADECLPLNHARTWLREASSREFFVYRDQKSAVAWRENGASAENSNSMLHFLLNSVIENHGVYCEVTMVCDGVTTLIAQLFTELQASFRDALFHARLEGAA